MALVRYIKEETLAPALTGDSDRTEDANGVVCWTLTGPGSIVVKWKDAQRPDQPHGAVLAGTKVWYDRKNHVLEIEERK